MSVITSLIHRFFGNQNNQNDNQNQNSQSQTPQVDEDEEALQRAIEESKHDFEQNQTQDQTPEIRDTLNPDEIEAVTEKQLEEIWALVYNKDELIKVLNKLPDVDPNNAIFSEFW